MHVRSAAVALVVALAVGGCGAPGAGSASPDGGGGSVDGSPGQGPDSPVGSTPQKCAKGGDGAAEFGDCKRRKPGFTRVEPQPGMARVHPVRWESFEVVDDDTLLVRYYGGVEPCSVLDHVDVSYGDAHVTVTVFEGAEPASQNEPCPELAMAKEVAVDLDEPLNGREVIDGARM